MAVLIVTASVPAGAGTTAPAATGPAASIDVKPAAITMDAPPGVDAQRSCVLYQHGGGQMKVLSAEPSDPVLTVRVREDQSAGSWVVETMIPAGYETPASRQVEIVVKAELVGQIPHNSNHRRDAARLSSTLRLRPEGSSPKSGATPKAAGTEPGSRNTGCKPGPQDTGGTPVPQMPPQEVVRIPVESPDATLDSPSVSAFGLAWRRWGAG